MKDKEKKQEDRGHLVSANAYPIQPNNSGMRVAINSMTMLKVGDKVFQFLRDDGVILLIPERLFVQMFGSDEKTKDSPRLNV